MRTILDIINELNLNISPLYKERIKDYEIEDYKILDKQNILVVKNDLRYLIKAYDIPSYNPGYTIFLKNIVGVKRLNIDECPFELLAIGTILNENLN